MIPNLFRKEPIPMVIPKDMEEIIKKLSKSKNKEQFLKSSFEYITKKYKLRRSDVITYLPGLFRKDVSYLWDKKGFLYCTPLNYLLRVMLVKSGLFSDTEIELKISNTWYITLHQYLRIKINKEKYINVDPWNYTFGIKFGDFGYGFYSGSIFPIRQN